MTGPTVVFLENGVRANERFVWADAPSVPQQNHTVENDGRLWLVIAVRWVAPYVVHVNVQALAPV